MLGVACDGGDRPPPSPVSDSEPTVGTSSSGGYPTCVDFYDCAVLCGETDIGAGSGALRKTCIENKCIRNHFPNVFFEEEDLVDWGQSCGKYGRQTNTCELYLEACSKHEETFE